MWILWIMLLPIRTVDSGLGSTSNGHYLGMFPVSYKRKSHRLYGASITVTEYNPDKDLGSFFNTSLPKKFSVFVDSVQAARLQHIF